MDAMKQRVEFALRAVRTENFRELCGECGSVPRLGTSGRSVFCINHINPSPPPRLSQKLTANLISATAPTHGQLNRLTGWYQQHGIWHACVPLAASRHGASDETMKLQQEQ